MSLESRLRKLEQAAGRTYAPGECPRNEIGAIIGKGEPVPKDARRCRACWGVHVLEIWEIIIESPQKPAA